jgi:hypothetical protein
MHTHVSVTHTPLAAVSIFNKVLNLKNFILPLEGARFVVHFIRGLSYVLMKLIQFVGYLFFKKSKVFLTSFKRQCLLFLFYYALL